MSTAYFKNASGSNWNTAANWFSNAAATTALGGVPWVNSSAFNSYNLAYATGVTTTVNLNTSLGVSGNSWSNTGTCSLNFSMANNSVSIYSGNFSGTLSSGYGNLYGGTFSGPIASGVGYIYGGTFSNTVSWGGYIEGGTFTNSVTSGGWVHNGTFSGAVTTNYHITNGTFSGPVTTSTYGNISGGTFSNTVTNNGSISGGSFSAAVTSTSVISGGTFTNSVSVSGSSGTIKGGTYNSAVSLTDSLATIEGGTFTNTLSIGSDSQIIIGRSGDTGTISATGWSTWTGTASSDVTASGNWSNGVPTSGTKAVYAQSGAHAPSGIILSKLYVCGTLASSSINATGSVVNNGTISDGSYSGAITNMRYLAGGNFNGTVSSTGGTISGGTYSGTATVANTVISGGTFNNTVSCSSTINGGTFNGVFTNTGIINGGTFTLSGGVSGAITGGMFNAIGFTNWSVLGITFLLTPPLDANGSGWDGTTFYLSHTATTLNSFGTGTWNGNFYAAGNQCQPVYLALGGDPDNINDGYSSANPVGNTEKAFEQAYTRSGWNVINVGPGTFADSSSGGYSSTNASNNVYAMGWPFRIVLHGAGATSSHFGGIDGTGNPDQGSGEQTNGYPLFVISDGTVDLGNITTNGSDDQSTINQATNAGNITLINAVAGAINANGGTENGGYNQAGGGSSVLLINTSLTGSISTVGGYGGSNGSGGGGGCVSLTSSSCLDVNASGNSGMWSPGGAGSVLLTSSTCRDVTVNGSDNQTYEDFGGSGGGSVNVVNSTTRNIVANGGSGAYGGAGGSVTATGSTLGNATLNGASAGFGGGVGGSVSLTGSQSGDIQCQGGSNQDINGPGSNGGTVNLNASNCGVIDLTPGSGDGSGNYGSTTVTNCKFTLVPTWASNATFVGTTNEFDLSRAAIDAAVMNQIQSSKLVLPFADVLGGGIL